MIEDQLNEIIIDYKKKAGAKVIYDSISADIACRQAYSQSKANWDLREYVFVIMLNQANRVIGYFKLSEGGVTGTVADVRLAFATALKSVSTGIILAHNHPSHTKKPSLSDDKLTKKFKDAGILLDIKLLDHIILCGKEYYSYADEGRL